MGLLRANAAMRRGACLAALLFATGATPAGAQTRTEQTLLVLRNGRVVEGRIEQNAGGYHVVYDNGSMLVPRSQVLLLAESRKQAYAKLKDTLPRNSVKSNLRLARWCMSNLLYTQARAELREALALNPSHGETRRMMVRLDELLDPDSPRNQPRKQSFEERLMAPPTKSLAGLSRDSARLYVVKIQPMLMNSCATSGCHGPQAANGFRLSRVRISSGARRGSSERNLAATMRFIDPQNADASPLLVKPQGNHGRRGQPVFRGRAGARQQELLRRWVRSVARETSPPAVAQGKSQRRDQAVKSPDKRRKGASDYGYQTTPSIRAIRSQLEQRRVMNDLRSDGRPDAFDPKEFNRRTAREKRGPRDNPPSRGRVR